MGCGKTTFVKRLLRHTDWLIDGPPERLMWCYGEWQPMYATLTETIPNVEVVENLPDPTSFDAKTKNLVITDDLVVETNDRVTKLFTKKSHHCYTSVVYLVQNLLQKTQARCTSPLVGTFTEDEADFAENPNDNMSCVRV